MKEAQVHRSASLKRRRNEDQQQQQQQQQAEQRRHSVRQAAALAAVLADAPKRAADKANRAADAAMRSAMRAAKSAAAAGAAAGRKAANPKHKQGAARKAGKKEAAAAAADAVLEPKEIPYFTVTVEEWIWVAGKVCWELVCVPNCRRIVTGDARVGDIRLNAASSRVCVEMCGGLGWGGVGWGGVVDVGKGEGMLVCTECQLHEGQGTAAGGVFDQAGPWEMLLWRWV
jgi:hypothetical protein